RVSAADQNESRQLEAVGECDRVYIEKQSARSRADRVKLEECIRYLRDGDELVVASMDRLARSLVDLKQIVGEITAKGASVEFVHERATYAAGAQDPRADLMLSLLGAFAEFERAIIRERQAEGIAIAKAKGKYKGRKRVLTDAQVDKARARVGAGGGRTERGRGPGGRRAASTRRSGGGASGDRPGARGRAVHAVPRTSTSGSVSADGRPTLQLLLRVEVKRVVTSQEPTRRAEDRIRRPRRN